MLKNEFKPGDLICSAKRHGFITISEDIKKKHIINEWYLEGIADIPWSFFYEFTNRNKPIPFLILKIINGIFYPGPGGQEAMFCILHPKTLNKFWVSETEVRFFKFKK